MSQIGMTPKGFGAFGKMPSLGDFFRLGLNADLVAAWDGWLQTTLPEARARLGVRYEACYMSAPVWRFVLPPGVAGAAGVVGVMMPSVDRVGRQFPLLLMANTLPDAGPPLRMLMHQGPVLDALEALALDCLDDAMTREGLGERLAALALSAPGFSGRVAQADGVLVVSSAAADVLCADLALDLAGGALSRSCAFLAAVGGAARLMLTDGLPQGATAVRMFDVSPGDPAGRVV